MTHGAPKPNLAGALEVLPTDGIDSLSLAEAAALLAFWRSTKERAPVSPSRDFTYLLGAWLQRRGVLEFCLDSNPSDPAGPPARAIYDPLSWRYVWPCAADSDFAPLLRIRLRGLAAERSLVGARVDLWRMLADSELEGYLGNLLRRHCFDPRWALDLRDLGE